MSQDSSTRGGTIYSNHKNNKKLKDKDDQIEKDEDYKDNESKRKIEEKVWVNFKCTTGPKKQYAVANRKQSFEVCVIFNFCTPISSNIWHNCSLHIYGIKKMIRTGIK